MKWYEFGQKPGFSTSITTGTIIQKTFKYIFWKVQTNINYVPAFQYRQAVRENRTDVQKKVKRVGYRLKQKYFEEDIEIFKFRVGIYNQYTLESLISTPSYHLIRIIT